MAASDMETLDLTGHRCPIPVVKLEAALRRAGPGAHFLVIADDPIAAVDIPHFCSEGGHDARRLEDRDGACVFLVTRSENRPVSG